jgi:hypothetical protein
LNALNQLATERFPDANGNFNEEASNNTKYFVAEVLLAWFWSLGISYSQLKEMMKDLGHRQIFQWLKSIKSVSTEVATLYPLPSYVDVTLKLSSVGFHLFGVTKEESFYTHQFFSSLVIACGKLDALPQPDKLLAVVGMDDPPTYRAVPEYLTLHKTTSKHLGKAVREEVRQLRSTGGRYNMVKVENLCHPFGQALLTVLQEPSKPELMTKEMISSFLTADEKEPPLSDIQQAIILRSLISRIGITRIANVLDLLIEEVNKLDWHMCKKTWEEITFVRNAFVT